MASNNIFSLSLLASGWERCVNVLFCLFLFSAYSSTYFHTFLCGVIPQQYDMCFFKLKVWFRCVYTLTHTHAINRLSGSTILSIVNVLVHLSKFIFSLFRSFLRSLSPSPFHSFFITCFFLYMCVCVRVCGKSLFSVCLLVCLLCSFSLGKNTITFLLFLGLVAYK